jgi:hypothetical protein
MNKLKITIVAMLVLIAPTLWADGDASKIVAYIPLADKLSTPMNPRCFNTPRNAENVFNFDDVVDTWMEPLYTKAGFRRFMLWNPFGLNPTMQTWKFTANGISGSYQTPQSVDAYLLLQQTGLARYKVMAETFVDAINRFKKKHADAQVIVYNGTAMGCPSFNGLSDEAIVARLKQSLAPCFDTKCDMAFDSACEVPPDHWLAKFYPTIEKAGLHVYVESAPWRYDYLRKRSFISDLLQLKNVAPANCVRMVPTKANGGFVGFLDPKTEVKGDRLGALFGSPPAKYKGDCLAWYSKVVPRAFNAGQIDGIILHMDPFLGAPYTANPAITVPQLISELEQTKETNYADYLGN